MDIKRKRLTLDLDPTFQRRLKAIAALKGVSMRRYCQDAIDGELAKDEGNGIGGLLSDRPDHELFAELQTAIFGNRTLPGNSADLIREAREIRDAETEAWRERSCRRRRECSRQMVGEGGAHRQGSGHSPAVA